MKSESLWLASPSSQKRDCLESAFRGTVRSLQPSALSCWKDPDIWIIWSPWLPPCGRTPRQVQLGRDPEHIGGIMHPYWSGVASGSPRRSRGHQGFSPSACIHHDMDPDKWREMERWYKHSCGRNDWFIGVSICGGTRILSAGSGLRKQLRQI